MLRKSEIPILEYDDAPTAIIEPSEILPRSDVPRGCVFCFFQDVLTKLRDDGTLIEREDVRLGSEIGRNPVYTLPSHNLLVTHAGLGAPLSGSFLDEMIAYGCRDFIACGGAGVLQRGLVMGHLVVPTDAVRDEGTSYHYLPPSRTVAAHPSAIAAITATLTAQAIPFVQGRTWTTDAPYRETREKVNHRIAEGCIAVEMEAAAFFAIAKFRGVRFGQILYGGDDLSGEIWDNRGWQRAKNLRERVFWLAAEACRTLVAGFPEQ